MKADRLFVETKLSHIRSYYSELLELLEHSDEQIRSSRVLLRALERLIQLIVDEILDVNKHIIRAEGFATSEDTQSTFHVLAEEGVLKRDFARKIAPVVGLRNRLVHRYEEVDIEQMLSHVRKNHKDFKEFVREIMDYVKGDQNG